MQSFLLKTYFGINVDKNLVNAIFSIKNKFPIKI